MEFRLNSTGEKLYFGDNENIANIYLLFPKKSDKVQVITKIYVDEQYRGQGIAGKLMATVVEYANKNNIKLEATCPYAISWFEKNNKDK
ncbi:N-acetyltransferase [Gemella sp. GH3]|uniref:GNAT family N-acetyltransferase n=1 Tax=unclassified Gemella TaxID=2624949 RepID=UPI0015CFA48C|nr:MULTISPECIES: GNAT family N-acetyltransferase [unclassified Gemella]MBF0713698.1 N-acetyltransferase [Gemella sp. GH3.1]NYS50650.1 N-acetyltransferase [Gemella sp. GH3]